MTRPKPTQNEQVLALLRHYPEGVTALDALREVGTMRMAARVADLRALGYVIHSEMVSVSGSRRVARYRLEREETLWQPR